MRLIHKNLIQTRLEKLPINMLYLKVILAMFVFLLLFDKNKLVNAQSSLQSLGGNYSLISWRGRARMRHLRYLKVVDGKMSINSFGEMKLRVTLPQASRRSILAKQTCIGNYIQSSSQIEFYKAILHDQNWPKNIMGKYSQLTGLKDLGICGNGWEPGKVYPDGAENSNWNVFINHSKRTLTLENQYAVYIWKKI